MKKETKGTVSGNFKRKAGWPGREGMVQTERRNPAWRGGRGQTLAMSCAVKSFFGSWSDGRVVFAAPAQLLRAAFV